MKVTRISIYPIKGTREVSLGDAQVCREGLAGDRRWMVVDAHGQFLQQRVLPAMSLVQATVQKQQSLVVDAPGMPQLWLQPPDDPQRTTVTVWRDTFAAADAGQDAAEWFSQYLRRECRVVFMDADTSRPVDSQYGQPGDVVSFADSMPLLLASEASLADLNRRMGKSIPMSRFRPNVTIDGTVAWQEDDWTLIRIGDVRLRVTHRSARCVVTTIDQQAGTKDRDGEPLKTLASFRRDSEGVYFGQNLLPQTTGRIRVGDPVVVVPANG